LVVLASHEPELPEQRLHPLACPLDEPCRIATPAGHGLLEQLARLLSAYAASFGELARQLVHSLGRQRGSPDPAVGHPLQRLARRACQSLLSIWLAHAALCGGAGGASPASPAPTPRAGEPAPRRSARAERPTPRWPRRALRVQFREQEQQAPRGARAAPAASAV